MTYVKQQVVLIKFIDFTLKSINTLMLYCAFRIIYYLDQQIQNILTIMSVSYSTATRFDIFTSLSGSLVLHIFKVTQSIKLVGYNVYMGDCCR
jgi:hypothetical protein